MISCDISYGNVWSLELFLFLQNGSGNSAGVKSAKLAGPEARDGINIKLLKWTGLKS